MPFPDWICFWRFQIHHTCWNHLLAFLFSLHFSACSPTFFYSFRPKLFSFNLAFPHFAVERTISWESCSFCSLYRNFGFSCAFADERSISALFDFRPIACTFNFSVFCFAPSFRWHCWSFSLVDSFPSVSCLPVGFCHLSLSVRDCITRYTTWTLPRGLSRNRTLALSSLICWHAASSFPWLFPCCASSEWSCL